MEQEQKDFIYNLMMKINLINAILSDNEPLQEGSSSKQFESAINGTDEIINALQNLLESKDFAKTSKEISEIFIIDIDDEEEEEEE